MPSDKYDFLNNIIYYFIYSNSSDVLRLTLRYILESC